MAEVVKYGAIRDPAFFDWLENESARINTRDADALGSLIETSVRNKAGVVAEDELESGARALLNFGHTFGHALETVSSYSRYLHGEAVAIGMVVAARLSESRGLCAPGVKDRISELLVDQGLPAALPPDLSSDAIMAAMALDKKVLGGRTRLVLLTAMGSAIIDSRSTAAEIHAALEDSR
jgi:3-dehydroquinate synthase